LANKSSYCTAKGFFVKRGIGVYGLTAFVLLSGGSAMAGSGVPTAPVLTCDAPVKIEPVLLDALCASVGDELVVTFPKLRVDRSREAIGDIRLVIASANPRRITAFLAHGSKASGTLSQGPTLGLSVMDTQMLPEMMTEFASFLIEEAKLK
jgi:hypothetical protein